MGVDEALSKVGATSIPSGNYKVIINSDAMVSLISTFAVVFSGDAVQKGLSLLKGKEGEVLYGDGKGCHMGLFYIVFWRNIL